MNKEHHELCLALAVERCLVLADEWEAVRESWLATAEMWGRCAELDPEHRNLHRCREGDAQEGARSAGSWAWHWAWLAEWLQMRHRGE